jgi:tripartite-type tricarboxylate transporter receptor subunit TctC
MNLLPRLLLAFVAATVLMPWEPSQAQTFPAGPVKVLIGFPAGGPPDLLLRRMATRLGERLGTSVVVENRPGASGTIAASSVAHAAPDGQTLLFGVAANLAVAPATMKNPPYDPVTAFTPIVEVARGPYVWLVRSDAPARNMREFVAWAKASPGKLNYATPGIGSVHHLATELLSRTSGLELVHVPYRTGLYAPLLAGEVQAMFESLPGPLPYLESGKLRALGVTGPRRLARLPDVPTLAEQGLAGMDANSWWGFVGPAGLPSAVVARLNTETHRVLEEPEMKSLLAGWGIEPSSGSPEAFGAYIAQESAHWKAIVQRLDVPLE